MEVGNNSKRLQELYDGLIKDNYDLNSIGRNIDEFAEKLATDTVFSNFVYDDLRGKTGFSGSKADFLVKALGSRVVPSSISKGRKTVPPYKPNKNEYVHFETPIKNVLGGGEKTAEDYAIDALEATGRATPITPQDRYSFQKRNVVDNINAQTIVDTAQRKNIANKQRADLSITGRYLLPEDIKEREARKQDEAKATAIEYQKAEKAQRQQIDDSLRSLKEKAQKDYNEYAAQLREQEEKIPAFIRADKDAYVSTTAADLAMSVPAATLKLVDDTEKLLNAPKKGGNWANSMWAGAKDAADAESFFSFGLSGLAKSATIKGIADRYLEGKNLSDKENDLMEALATNTLVAYMRKDDVSGWYTAGQIAEMSAEISTQFLGTNFIGSAATKAVARGIGKFISKNAPKIVAKLAAKGLGGTALRGARFVGKGATDTFVGGTAQSLFMPNTYDSAIQTKTGTVAFGKGKGQYDVTPSEYNLAQSLVSGAIEGISERAGGAFAGFGGKVAKNIIPTSWGKLSSKGIVGGIIKAGSTANRYLSKAGINGQFGELAEEVFGQVLNRINGTTTKEEWANFWSKDNMLQMIGGFAPMSLVGLGANTASVAKSSLDAYRADRALLNFAQQDNITAPKKMLDEIKNVEIENLHRVIEGYVQELGGVSDGKLNDIGVEFNKLAANVVAHNIRKDIYAEADSEISPAESVSTDERQEVTDENIQEERQPDYTIPQLRQGDEVEYDNAQWIVGDVADEDGEYQVGEESIPLRRGNVLLLGADGESVRVIDSAADLYSEQQNVDDEIESKRQAIYEQYRPVMNVDTGNITQLSNVAGTDNIAYVVKGKVVYDEDGNIDYDRSDDTIYYKVYDKEGNEVDGGTPKPIYLKTRRAEFGKVLSDVPIEEYVDNELYPQEQDNIQQAINNGPTNIEQSTPTESVTPNEYQEVTEKKDSTEFDENGGYSNIQNTVLSDEEADLLMSAMEQNAEAMPVIELTPDNWVAEFGQNRTVSTPIGDVKMGDNQLAKLFLKKRTREFGMIKPTLINPDVIIEKTAVADNAERNTKLLFVKTFKDENGQKHVHFENVTVQKGGLEVSISSHIVDKSAIRKELANGIVIYNKPELTSIGSDGYLTETHEGQSDLVPTQKANSDLQYKGTINNLNEQGEFYNSLPRNKKGEIDESQMSAEQKIMYAQIEFGQRADLVRDYVAEQSKALGEKIAKLTNKTGKSVAEYKELAAMQEDKNVFVEYLNEQRQQQEQATPRRMVEEAAAEREERRAAEKEQREQAIREKEEREGVPDFMQDTPEDARLRGFRLRTGERIDRQEPIEVSKYNTARRKFTNDTGAVEGGRPTVKRTIIDNAQTKLQPSHRGGRSNIYHFITEAQPKERTDKASRVSAAQIAANINPEEITGGITAYNGSPIANNRLEVIQGNNRAEALRLMYEEYPKSAEAYKQYLIDNAENYGMSADEVRTMKEPIAVDIYEGTDGDAILLGQYTQQDVESGGVHRINPSGVIKHLKSQNMLDRFITGLLKGVDEENTVSDVISANLRDVLPILDKTGAISMTQRQGFFDERGDVTSGAIDDFKGILTSLITEGGYANINSDFLNLPDSAKTALYLQTYRAILNQEYGRQILGEIQDSILLYTLVFGNNNKGKVGVDESRREVMSWLMTAQPDFNTLNEDGTYPLVDMREKFSNFAAELAILYKSTNLRSSKDKGRGLYTIWDDFYNLLEGKGDLFTAGERKSLQESINENFNIDYVPIRQNERNTLGSRGEASRAGRRGSESELSIGEQSEAGTETADDRGRAEADIAEAVKEIDVEPTEAQKKAGNYKKGHVKIQGFDITIENPKGAIRKGVDDNGKAWSTEMKNHYGYFKNTEGKDGDHIDVFIGDNPNSKRIFVVDQVNPKTKEFDESKVMLGFDTEDEAKKAYLSNYSKDWKGFKDITYVDVDTFKEWLYDGAKQRKPFGEYSNIRFRSIKDINDRFNEELQQQIDGTLPKGHVYSLGMPNDVLRSAGFPNVPIELSASHLEKKSIAAQHPFELKEIKSLVKALQDPMAVFAYGDKKKSQNVIVEIQHEGKNFVVGIHFNWKRGSAEISSIRGLYPKDNAEWLNWISQGKLLYVNKEKIQILIDQQRRNLADVEYLDLNYVAKVIKDFDNPTLSEEKNEETRLKASKRKARGATTEKLEELVTLLKKTGFADVKTGEDFYNALAEIEDKEGSRFMIGKQATEADERAIADETADIKAKAIADGTFMKAPNGKDTNLTERQWLQVRTKAFKKWFGDWENAYKLELIENLQPIDVDNKGLSRERAEEEYKKIGTSKTNRYDNRRIEFVNNAFGKIARHKNSALILDIIPQLNDLFESAIPIYFEEEREPLKSTNIVGSRNYLGKVRVNDEDYYVRITAQELTPSWKQNEKQGKSNFHNMAVSDIAIYDESGSSVTAKDYSIDNDNRNRFVDAKLQHFFETAREARENSSKVVDENGEPMVVYHGTWVSRGENYDKWNPEKEAPFYQFNESDNGIHFGTEEQVEYIIARKRKLFEEEQGDYTGFSHIYASFLNIRNVYRTYDAGLKWDKVISEAKSNGYDGLVYGNTHEGLYKKDSYVVFSPTQIKSATDNIGTFNGEDEDIRYMRPNGTVLGFVKGNTIYLNPDEVSLNTPIHEFGHLWVSQVKEHFPDLWAKGKELFLESDYLRKVQADENYRHLDLDGQIDEAMARAIGDRGEQELDKTLLEKILDWIAEVWDKIGGVFGIDNLTSEQISNLTLQDFTDMATSELLSGENLTERVNGNRGGATRYNTADETADIKAKAIADGTFMKAPNGKDTNLTERQWLQVRTKAFKKWFGDWEKTARIEKLKKTKPIEITGEEYKGKYELNRDSAKAYIKDSLRGEYTNKDTGDTILLAKDGAQKVTSHSMGNEAHLKSIAVIPELIEKSIFIDELPNEKNNGKYDSYRYYVSGLKIGDVDYTVKLAIGIDEYGNKYYDHSLTEIEKGKLIDEVGALSTTLPSSNQSALSEYKDNRLFSLLQTNSSKVVDENGEPMVVYHGTNKFGFTVFDKEFSDDKTSIFFTDRVDIAKGYAGVNADVRSLYDDDTAGGYSKDEMLSMLFADVDISSHTNGWDVANDILPYITEDIGITAEYDDEDGVLTLSSDYTGDTYRLTDEEFSWEKVENWLGDNADLENVIDKNAGIYGVFVNARNVLDIDAGGSMWAYIPKEKVKGVEGVGNMDTRDIVEHAKKLNYDGVYIKDLLDTGGRGYGLVGDIEGDIFISLVDKNQIKSATDNIGTFDGEDGDIRYMLVNVQDEKAIDEERRRPKFEIKGEDVYTTMYTTRVDTETEIDVLYNGNDFEKALSEAEGYNDNSDREGLTVSVEAMRLKIPVAAIKEEYDYDNEEYDGDVAPFVEDYIDDFVENVDYDRYETGRDMFDVYKSKPDTDEHELIGTITDKLQQQTGLYVGKYSTFYITKNGEMTDEEADKDGVPNAFVSMRIADHTHNRQNGDDTLNIVIADKDPTKTKFQSSKEDLRYTTKDNAEEIVKDILDFWRQYAREYFGDVSEQFNSDLDRFKRNRLLSNYKFNLGIPSPILKAAGLNASNIQMSQSVLDKYLDKHNLKTDDLRELPEAIRTPIMVYEWGDKARNSVIVTSIPRGEERITTTIRLTRDGNKLNVNEISSIYGKSAERLIRDINTPKSEFGKDNLRYVDKKQVLDWFAVEAPKASSQTQQELITATKVIENFENPPINEKKVINDTTNDMVRYSIRANDQLDREDEIMGKKAAEIYEARVKLRKQMNQSDPKKMPNKEIFDDLSRKTEAKRMKFVETVADQYRAVKSFVDTLNEHGYNISDYNNWYMNVFALAGKNEAEFEKYQAERSKPLQRAAKAAMDSGQISYRELENYLILKHGQERNEYFTERDKGLGIEPLKDYSGVEAVMFEEFCKRTGIEVKTQKESVPQLAEANNNIDILYTDGVSEFSENGRKLPIFEVERRFAEWKKVNDLQSIIADYEQKIGEDKIDDLWAKINYATQFVLDMQKAGGLTSEKTYEKASGMWKYFVPLRGFDVGTAKDEFDYDLNGVVLFTDFKVEPTLGRTRRSTSPLVWTEQMAHITIDQKNRNLLNQSLRRLASISMARRDNILLLSKLYKDVDTKDEVGRAIKGEVKYPPKHTGDTEHDAKAYADWIAEMKAGIENGTIEEVRQDNVNFGKIVPPAAVKQHIVRVYEGGVPTDVIFNTPPAVPRAINGLNHRTSIGNAWLLRQAKAGTRLMAQSMTTLNPAFVGKNFTRDYLFANAMLVGRENADYVKNFNANVIKAAPILMSYVRGNSLLGWTGKNIKNDKYGGWLTEFVMNGGKTGFSQMLKFEKMSKDFRRQTERGDKTTHYGLNDYINFIEAINDFAENITRFSAYCASRQAGRSIERSISDAKELTINFNRHGTMGGIWGEFKALSAFANASIQALLVFYRGIKANPKRVSAIISGYVAMPIAMSIMARLVGGDDSDYFKLSKYDRQNNLCLPLFGGGFVKIPLPQELRVFYKLGDEIALSVWNNEPIDMATQEVLMGALDLLPSFASGATSIGDVTGGKMSTGEFIGAHNPITVLQPATQIISNRNFLNYRIYDDNKWGGRKAQLPEYRKALRNKGGKTYSPDFWVKLSELLSGVSGGTDLKRGAIEANPDIINHLMNGYFGGLYKSAVSAINVATNPSDFAKHSAIIKSFYTPKDNLRYTNDVLNAQYMNILKEAKKHADVYANYLKEGEVDRFEEETNMTEDEALDWRYLVKGIDKEVQELRNEIATAETPKERDEALRQLEALQREAIDMAAKLKK